MNKYAWALEKVDKEGTIELGTFKTKEATISNLMMRLSLTKRPRLKRIDNGLYSYEWKQNLTFSTRKVLFYIKRYGDE